MTNDKLQLELRSSYAERRRYKFFNRSKRVIWKTKSRHVA